MEIHGILEVVGVDLVRDGEVFGMEMIAASDGAALEMIVDGRVGRGKDCADADDFPDTGNCPDAGD